MFLKGRVCSECGSSLVCRAENHKEPHCFVCGYNHPAIQFHMRGPVSQLIHRIELDGKKVGMKIQMLSPSILFIDGYAYVAKSLIGLPETWQEDSWETRKIRGAGT